MAALSAGQAVVNTTPVLLFTIPTAQQGFVSFTTNTAGGVFIGQSSSATPLSTTNGCLVPQNVPVSIDLKAQQGTQIYAVAAGAAMISWIFGA